MPTKVHVVTVMVFPVVKNGCESWTIEKFRSVAQLCPTLCDPMDCSMPGFPVHHQLLDLAQSHVLGIGDAIQSTYPLSPLSPPTLNLSQHQDLFQESSLHIKWSNIGASGSASVLPMTNQGWFPLGLTGLISLLSNRHSRVFSGTRVWKHQFFYAQPSLWSISHLYTQSKSLVRINLRQYDEYTDTWSPIKSSTSSF